MKFINTMFLSVVLRKSHKQDEVGVSCILAWPNKYAKSRVCVIINQGRAANKV